MLLFATQRHVVRRCIRIVWAPLLHCGHRAASSACLAETGRRPYLGYLNIAIAHCVPAFLPHAPPALYGFGVKLCCWACGAPSLSLCWAGDRRRSPNPPEDAWCINVVLSPTSARASTGPAPAGRGIAAGGESPRPMVLRGHTHTLCCQRKCLDVESSHLKRGCGSNVRMHAGARSSDLDPPLCLSASVQPLSSFSLHARQGRRLRCSLRRYKPSPACAGASPAKSTSSSASMKPVNAMQMWQRMISSCSTNASTPRGVVRERSAY